METTRLTELKKKYADKTLNRAERQNILEEIAAEQFRLDNRKVISLRKSSKLKAGVGLMSFIACIITLIINRLDPDDLIKPLDIALIVIALVFFVFLGFCFVQFIKHKAERPDELARQLSDKADNSASITIFTLLIAAAFIFYVAGGKSVTVYTSDFFWIVCMITSFHAFLREILFLHLDKADADIDEEE